MTAHSAPTLRTRESEPTLPAGSICWIFSASETTDGVMIAT